MRAQRWVWLAGLPVMGTRDAPAHSVRQPPPMFSLLPSPPLLIPTLGVQRDSPARTTGVMNAAGDININERIREQKDGEQPSEASPENAIRLVPRNVPGLGIICYGDRGAWLQGLTDPVVLGLSQARQDPTAE